MLYAAKQLMTGIGMILLSAVFVVGCYAMDDFPEEVEIDALANLYEGGVVFDHAMHVDATDNCSECHHHTTEREIQTNTVLNVTPAKKRWIQLPARIVTPLTPPFLLKTCTKPKRNLNTMTINLT